MSRVSLAIAVAFIVATPLAGQQTVNDTVIAQIKTEGFQRSAVMDTLSWLSDVHGPRLTDEELTKQESAIDPADPSADSAPKSYWDEEQDWQKMLAKQTEIFKFFAAEGIALLVEPSPIAEDVRIGGFYDRAWRPAFPGFVIAREPYGRTVRMLRRKQSVKVAFPLAAQVAEDVGRFHGVAEMARTA